MINYPQIFAEEQIEADFIDYYVVITGGGSIITIDGIAGERTSGEQHIVWGLHACSFSYATEGDKFPLGSVPLQNGSIELILLDDFYLNYDWQNAVLNLYCKNSYFEDILISCFRITRVDKEQGKVTLTLDNKYLSKARMKHQIDEKIPVETLSAQNTLIEIYKQLNNRLNSTFSQARLDQDCLNSGVVITQIGDMSYREQLGQLSQIASANMLLKTTRSPSESGFHFADIDLRGYNPIADTGIETGKSIDNTGNIVNNPDTSVTGYIPINFAKTYIFDIGSMASATWASLRIGVYDEDKNLIASDIISDFATAIGKGYIIMSSYYEASSATGYIRFTVPSVNINNVTFYAVNHILRNWSQLNINLPVSVTDIKYTVGGTESVRTSNETTLTALNPNNPEVTQNHLYVVDTVASFNSIQSKERDIYAVVDLLGNVERLELQPSVNPVSWQGNAKYIVFAHGEDAIWLRNFLKVGDQIRYNDVEKTFTVNKVPDSQQYTLDLSENTTLRRLSVATGTEAVSKIAERIVGHKFYPFEGTYLNFPFIEPYDTIGLVDRYGNVYFSFVTEVSFAPYGSTQISNTIRFATLD